MFKPSNIAENILPAFLLMRRRLLLLVGFIWLCALPAAGYVYFSNARFIGFKANIFTLPALVKNKLSRYSTNKGQTKETAYTQDAYLLVLYNTKLMLTRYTGVDSMAGNKLAQMPLAGDKIKTPVIIKRPARNFTGQNDDFSVKPVPQ